MGNWKSLKRIVICLAVLAVGAAFLLWNLDYTSNKIKVSVLDYEYTDAKTVIDGRLNINLASADTLALLDGIGDKTAVKIVEYRNAHGDFSNIDELKKISGIGSKTVEKIRDKICVGE